MIKNIRKSVYVSVFACLFITIISCEKDFTDIGSKVITNTKFDTDTTFVKITTENSPLEKIQSDNISRQLGQYLLGVYANPNYEKLEASIVSQLSIARGLKVVDKVYGADTTVFTKIDTVFLKLPYQVTLNSDGGFYELDSVFGDKSKAFNLNIYRSNTFMNLYNPADPTKNNKFFSNDVFEKTGSELNNTINFPFKPNRKDTILPIKRRLFNDAVATIDTLRFTATAASQVPVPFARIPLNEDKFKEFFLDEYASGNFSSQEAFNDYFRGLIVEASGNEGSLVSYNFNAANSALRPSIEVYYTNTVLKSGTIVLDTISKNDSFPLAGFRVNTFKMDDKVYPVNNQIKIQGTAGSEANIVLFDQNKIDELKLKNWLINDASLTFYIDESVSPEMVPNRLYMYKNNATSGNTQIKDALSEAAFGGINGFLTKDEDGSNRRYIFKITDYISDILSGETTYSSTLKLKVFNPSDSPTSGTNTAFNNFSWNPKAVTLLNNSSVNGDKKALLKISYSVKK